MSDRPRRRDRYALVRCLLGPRTVSSLPPPPLPRLCVGLRGKIRPSVTVSHHPSAPGVSGFDPGRRRSRRCLVGPRRRSPSPGSPPRSSLRDPRLPKGSRGGRGTGLASDTLFRGRRSGSDRVTDRDPGFKSRRVGLDHREYLDDGTRSRALRLYPFYNQKCKCLEVRSSLLSVWLLAFLLVHPDLLGKSRGPSDVKIKRNKRVDKTWESRLSHPMQ